QLETFAQQGDAGGGLHLWDMRHVRRAQEHTENEPCRHLGLRAIPRPAEPPPAEQSRVEPDRIGPVETDLPLRRTMGGNRVGYRVHTGKERPARRPERFVGLKYDRELDQVVTSHPYQRPRSRLRRHVAAMRKCIAE